MSDNIFSPTTQGQAFMWAEVVKIDFLQVTQREKNTPSRFFNISRNETITFSSELTRSPIYSIIVIE